MTVVRYPGGFLRGTAAERAAFVTTNLNAGWIWVEEDTNPPLLYYWTGSAWRLFTTKDVSETLTGKTLTSPTITTPTMSAPLTVANGGTGAGTLTGVLKGNGTSAVTAAATVGISEGGTGQTTATLGFDALSPMSAAGDIIVGSTSGTRVRMAKAIVGQQVLRTKYDLSGLEYANSGVFPSSGGTLSSTNGRMWGYYSVGAGAAGFGMLSNLAQLGSAPGFTTFAAADGQKGAKFTPTAASGNQQGLSTGTSVTCRQWNPRVKMKFRLDNNVDTRMFMGFNNTGGAKTGDDPINASIGFMFGKIATATNANFVILHNDASGATVLDTVAAADNSTHQIEMRADDANTKWWWSFDNGAETGVTTDIPTQGGALGWIAEVETTNTTQPLFHIFWIEIESG